MAHQSQKGFTLVEVLVTLSIFGVVLTGTTASLISSLDTERAVKNNFIASGLAQEGFEIVRNIRDSGFLNQTSLPNGIFRLQWDDVVLNRTAGPIASEPTLKRDVGTGLWSYDTSAGPGAVDTLFKRTVSVQGIIQPGSTPPVEIGKDVTVTINWSERSAQKSLTTETHFYSWY